MRITILALLPLILLATACSSEPVFPLEPQIEYVDIQPRTVKSLTDQISITFRFQDGDGDLGGEIDQGVLNLMIIDSRINDGLTEAQATNSFSLPNLTPEVQNPSIQGLITVKLGATIVRPGRLEDSVRYQIKLVDRQGNIATPIDGEPGNVVWTDFIKVVR